jgi:hypothetical protein
MALEGLKIHVYKLKYDKCKSFARKLRPRLLRKIDPCLGEVFWADQTDLATSYGARFGQLIQRYVLNK